jgi:antitoxin MazE
MKTLIILGHPDPNTLDTSYYVGYTMDIHMEALKMVTKVQKWGNSQGLRLAKQVLEDAHISIGDDVDVTTRDGQIVITPARRIRGGRSLQELVSRIPKDYKVGEVEWGEPVGKEVW